MPANKSQLAKYVGASKGKSGSSKASGRKPKFDASAFSQSAMGTPF